MANAADTSTFPCTITLNIPFPSARHASIALQALGVDQELSSLVRRALSVSAASPGVLDVRYAATTNRMLRVAVNGFCDSLGVVLGVMEELDVDTVMKEGKENILGVQGLMPVEGDGLS